MAIEPTAQDQYMLELLNRARLNPQAEADRLIDGDLNEGITPGTISTAAKQPLAFNLKLFQSAQSHSQWMLANNVFAHAGANGSQPGTRATSNGYVWNYIGENIAWQGTTGTPNWTALVKQQHEELFIDTNIAHRGHRTNMMSPLYREIGISSVLGVFTSNGTAFNTVMTTQDFGKDFGGNAFLTGVAYTDTVTNDNFYTVGEGLGNITINAVGNGQTFTTTSLTAGGYSLRLAPGSYSVTFRGDFNHDGITDTSTARIVTIGTQNIKQDFTSDTQSTEGIDILNGSSNADTIEALGGNDRISGLGGNDLLRGQAGNDFLDGGIGVDSMSGGIGNDAYVVDNVGDTVTESLSEGTDNVQSSITYTLGNNVENLTLTGTASINGTGNSLNNIITGNSGSNTLNGGAGNDTLNGGAGNDRYLFNSSVAQGTDIINEAVGAGIDAIEFTGNSAVRINLNTTTAQTINTNLVLTVINLENVTGGAGNDTITGNTLANTIAGGAGNDTLAGGTGTAIDAFVFGSAGLKLLTAMGIDTISDFTVGIDKIQLSKSAFSALAVAPVAGSTPLALAVTDFSTINTTNDSLAATATGSIVYNKYNGHLFYNSNLMTAGIGTNGGQFAQLSAGLNLTSHDFVAIV